MDREDFKKRYESFGGKLEDIRLRKSIRVNTLRTEERALVELLESKGVKLEKIPFLKHGYYAEARFSLGSTPEYLLGLYHLQEAASQLPVEIMAPKPKDVVLDMCAAPGSKTTQLSMEMDGKGAIAAIDLKRERIASLQNNLERLGCPNVAVYCLNALEIERLGTRFSKILLDAPCSGNYASEPGWFEKRDLAGIRRNAELQKRLLKAACDNLAEEGILVYSTCSLEREEDEENIKYAIDELGLVPMDIKHTGLEGISDSEMSGTIRLWPYRSGTQGFFAAKLMKPKGHDKRYGKATNQLSIERGDE